MNKVVNLEYYKNSKSEPTNTLREQPNHFVESNLKAFTLTGTIVPWTEEIRYGQFSDHKLIASEGREYFFISDSYWKSVLSCHAWEEVKVKGLLNPKSRILVPQLIFPKGPIVRKENPIDFATATIRKMAKKVGKHLNELVVIPAGLLVIFMAL